MSAAGSAPAFGAPHRHIRLTDSTNERARALAAAGAPSGTIVTADAQSAGRGRLGRAWTTPPGKALLYSAILRPLDRRHALLPLAVPLAVCEAIESLAPLRCEVKWPNDVWIRERKVAGVLIEARPPEWAVIGVGANVAVEPGEFAPDLRWPATSIGHGARVGDLRRTLDAALDVWTVAARDELLTAYRARDALLGREVSWRDDAGEHAGTARGVDEAGNLIVVVGGDSVALGAGEVSVRVA